MTRASMRIDLLLAVVAGLAAGLALLAFQVSNARGYMTDAPEACVNCHVMTSFHAGWIHGSHGKVATCNDCHVPHESLARKLAFKAWDGARHSFMFTFRMEPQVLRMNPAAEPVVLRNCGRCHEHQVMRTSHGSADLGRPCWDCHRETPHGRALSLSSAPWARRPALPSAGMPRPDPQDGRE